jgi:hypothetical protein
LSILMTRREELMWLLAERGLSRAIIKFCEYLEARSSAIFISIDHLFRCWRYWLYQEELLINDFCRVYWVCFHECFWSFLIGANCQLQSKRASIG